MEDRCGDAEGEPSVASASGASDGRRDAGESGRVADRNETFFDG